MCIFGFLIKSNRHGIGAEREARGKPICGCGATNWISGVRVYAWDMRVLCSEILIKFAKCSIAIDAALGALRGELHSSRL